MLSDNSAERADGKKGTGLAYFICIFCALFGSFFILVNGVLVKKLPIFTLILVQAILGSIILATGMLVVFKDDFSLTTDKEWGAFGFLNGDHAVEALLFFGPSSGFFGNAGYVISLLFFSPVIVSASFLMEPFIG